MKRIAVFLVSVFVVCMLATGASPKPHAIFVINTFGMKYFPKPSLNISSALYSFQSTAAPYVSFSRISGLNNMVLALYSSDFAAGVDTIRVGTVIVEYEYGTIDSVAVVALNGATVQVEAIWK